MQVSRFLITTNVFLPQLHYRLGMILYTKGDAATEHMSIAIADQIMLGINNLTDESPELQLEIAQLFELAANKAKDCADYVSSHSYLTLALSLLPTDH